MTENITYSFVVYHVSVTMDEQSIKDDLMKRYAGVEKVTRLFYEYDDGDDYAPKTSVQVDSSVQVDFTLPTDAEKIYREKNIVIGGICRRVRAIKRPRNEQPNSKPRDNGQRKSKPLCEQDLIDMFERQKQ